MEEKIPETGTTEGQARPKEKGKRKEASGCRENDERESSLCDDLNAMPKLN